MLAAPVLGSAAFGGPSLPIPTEIESRISQTGNSWSPLNQALERFHLHVDRFACERQLRLLASALAQLRSHLLTGAAGLEECLSRRFRGASLAPHHETTLRRDCCFDVRRAEWDAGQTSTPDVGPGDFSASLRGFLNLHAPLSLAELNCLAITETASTEPGERSERKNLLTRICFELAGILREEEGWGSQPELRVPSSILGKWQASGEWELQWEPGEGAEIKGGSGEEGGPLNPEPRTSFSDWKIVAWQPREMVTVRGPAVVFTDVTATAFGQDPSYVAHLLRDINYWRTVLDGASGIDIFGNCGISVGDADGDGQDEIYLCQPQGLPNRLYHQREPGIFEDVARLAGVDLLDNTSMALFADVLNRGRQDLILITASRPLLFLNDGRGRFSLVRNAFPPLPRPASLTGAALADYDRDGRLDIYVCAYAYFQGQGIGSIPAPYYDAHNGPPSRLYHNRGDGTFEDITAASGLDHGNDRFSFACAWNDTDDDGWPDLCVVNDFGRNNLYRNRRDGTFEEIAEGLAGYGAGMSAAFADLDGDGAAELYVGNMWSPVGERVTADPEFQRGFSHLALPIVRQFAMGNALYQKSRGEGTGKGEQYKKTPGAAGADRGRWAWCSDSFDLENDGQLDIYVVNGFLSSPNPERAPLDAYLWQEIVALSPHTDIVGSEYRAAWNAGFQLAHEGHSWNANERNVFFLNLGNGRFTDVSAASGLDFRDDGRSFAIFDYDGDGDSDLVMHNRTGPQLRLLRNDLAHSNHSLALRLTATTGNRDAIGARIELETPSGRHVRWLSCGSGFLAQHSKELVFGLGAHASASARVGWPGGTVSQYRNLKAGYRYYLVEGQPSPRREPLSARMGVMRASPLKGDRMSGVFRPPVASPQADAEAPPARFSTWLADPLPVPPLEALRLVGEPSGLARQGRALPYRLLWLWDPADRDAGGLQPFLQVQKQIAGRLVSWNGGSVPPGVAAALQYPPWKADARFRLFCSTLLAYLFNHRRKPVFPTGLLFELGERSALSSGPVSPLRVPGVPGPYPRLIKVYWGGAAVGELLKDYHTGRKTGVDALPFPGRSILCSFRRDMRSIGAALATTGLYSEAEMYLAHAVADNAADADAVYNLALVRRELGKIPLALSGAQAALSARHSFPEAENLLGVLLMQSGQHLAAQAHLETATRQAPDFVEAWNNLGYLLLLQKAFAPARAALEKALALAPNFSDALNNLGILWAQQGDLEKAGQLFRRALAVQPENEQAGNNLGVLYARQGKSREALATFRSVLEHNPDAASVLLNLARFEISLGETGETRHLLRTWLTRHPEDTAARQLLQNAEGKK